MTGTARVAVIGGTGLGHFDGLEIERAELVDTRFGQTSAPVVHGRLGGSMVCFLARHGAGHTIPPHRINYRANISALEKLGVRDILAVAAVGGIAAEPGPGGLVVPDQMIDYTWGREHTFFDGGKGGVEHVDFTRPYAENLRRALVDAGAASRIAIRDGGTYGATQGPRLESAAEIDRMERDGCDLVGMTGMPEAALAREAGLGYAHCALVVNAAAGRGPGEITMADIEAVLEAGMASVRTVIAHAVSALERDSAARRGG